MDDKTERQQVIHTLHMARLNYGKSHKRELALQVDFPGNPECHTDVAWKAYCNARAKSDAYSVAIKNLTKLLDNDVVYWSSRNVGFTDTGDLVVDGEWVADLDFNGEEYCVECARRQILAGGWDPESVLACYGYSNDVDHAVYCHSCSRLLQYGSYTYVIVDMEPDSQDGVAVPDLDNLMQYSHDDIHGEWYCDGDQENAVAYARRQSIQGRRYVVLYIDSEDRHNNCVHWDSAIPEE